jgi:hypothetical protein
MTVTVPPPIRQGDLLMLRDEDYLFGRGEVWLRVVVVYDIRWVRGEPWIFLRGRTVWAPSATRRERDVLVRSEAVRLRRRRGL